MQPCCLVALPHACSLEILVRFVVLPWDYFSNKKISCNFWRVHKFVSFLLTKSHLNCKTGHHSQWNLFQELKMNNKGKNLKAGWCRSQNKDHGCSCSQECDQKTYWNRNRTFIVQHFHKVLAWVIWHAAVKDKHVISSKRCHYTSPPVSLCRRLTRELQRLLSLY